MKKKIQGGLSSDQRGLIAIVVSVVLMLIMSLIVLALSQNTNREQRQALDRQLSDQAYYNAESGINDVANFLYARRDDATVALRKDNCNDITGLDKNIDGPSGVNKYTCVQYNRIPPTLEYSNLDTSVPRVIPIKSVDAGNNPVVLSELSIGWDDVDTNDVPAGACNFTNGTPTLPQNCEFGGLRAELTNPLGSRDAIRAFSASFFLLPSTSVGASPFTLSGVGPPSNQDNQGILLVTNCTNNTGNGRKCTKSITGLNGTNYFLTLRGLWSPVNVSVSGKDVGGNPVYFKDAQWVIDSTGRSSDVLRRLQVRIPVSSQYAYPGYALQSKDSICKLIEVTKNTVTGVGAAVPNHPTDCAVTL